jgi:hypothetical protein
MGQQIIVASPSERTLRTIGALLEGIARDESGQFSDFGDQVQAVGAGLSWKVVAHEVGGRAETAADYEENEDLDTRFRSAARQMHFFGISFDDVRLVRRLVCELADASDAGPDDIWIDTDHGWVLSASEFRRRVQSNPDWDWRSARDESRG